MAWERRKRTGNLYLTASTRVGGRIQRHYLGRGPLAEGIALAMLQVKEARIQRRLREREQLARLEAVHRQSLLLTKLIALPRNAEVVETPEQKPIGPGTDPMAAADLDSQRQHTAELFARAKRGDPAVLAELRTALKADPDVRRQLGDLGRHNQEAWLGVILAKRPEAQEAVRLQLEEMRAELTRPKASTLEKLLVEQVLAAWLPLQHYATLSASLALSPAGHTASFLNAFTKRHEASQRAYLKALRQLGETQERQERRKRKARSKARRPRERNPLPAAIRQRLEQGERELVGARN